MSAAESSEQKETQKGKKQWFFSFSNRQQLTKAIWKRYQSDNGQELKLEDIQALVFQKMREWEPAKHLNAYESLLFDPMAEREKINRDFFDWLWPMVEPEHAQLVKKPVDNTNWGVEDYRNMDIQRDFKDVTVESGQYRYDNTLPLYQRQPAHHHDRDPTGAGYTGRSLEAMNNGWSDMDNVLSIADRPYQKADHLDFEYYGQPAETGNTIQVGTAWKTLGSKMSSIGV
jgi:hypothetical protein